jgi:hypothetical protein
VIPLRVTTFTPADGRGILASACSTKKQKGIYAAKSCTYLQLCAGCCTLRRNIAGYWTLGKDGGKCRY